MKSSFKIFLILALVLGAVGILLARYFLASGAERTAAEAGVIASLAASLIGLSVKSWALRHSPKKVLGVTGGMFLVRIVLCGATALWLRATHGSPVTFVLAFTLMFFILFWVETAYLYSAWRSEVAGVAA